MHTSLALHRRDWLVCASSAAWLCSAQAQGGRAVATVAAASDLKFALEALAALFEQSTGHALRLVLGSSGLLCSQLLQGAPFDLFMSADESFALKLAQAGLTQDQGSLYAMGRIGMLVPKGGAIRADAQLQDLAGALKDGRLKRFAIANPEHAPYGLRAVQALKKAGLYEAMRGHLVMGENVSQAAQFALSGSAQGGIVAYSLALAPALQSLGDFALISDRWHQPLAQRMVLMRNASLAAQAFYAYLGTPAAQRIMRRYGFALPAP